MTRAYSSDLRERVVSGAAAHRSPKPGNSCSIQVAVESLFGRGDDRAI
jgi:hypothetical protein